MSFSRRPFALAAMVSLLAVAPVVPTAAAATPAITVQPTTTREAAPFVAFGDALWFAASTSRASCVTLVADATLARVQLASVKARIFAGTAQTWGSTRFSIVKLLRLDWASFDASYVKLIRAGNSCSTSLSVRAKIVNKQSLLDNPMFIVPTLLEETLLNPSAAAQSAAANRITTLIGGIQDGILKAKLPGGTQSGLATLRSSAFASRAVWFRDLAASTIVNPTDDFMVAYVAYSRAYVAHDTKAAAAIMTAIFSF